MGEVDEVPGVGDFVFEDAAGEGKDAVDELGHLEEVREVAGGGIDVGFQYGEKRVHLSVGPCERWVDASMLVIERAQQKGSQDQCERDESCQDDDGKAEWTRFWTQADSN